MSAPSPPTYDSPAANPWELFGLDLRTIGQDWLHAMRQWHQMAPLRWFELKPLVQVLRADRSVAFWQDGRWQPGGAATSAVAARAVQLPETLLLRRNLQLPDLPDAQVRDAVALDIFSSSPFEQDDVAWGYVQTRTGTGLQTMAAFASRAQIAAYLTQALSASPASWPAEHSEIWALPVHAGEAVQPIVLQGYGEGLAEQARRRRRVKAWTALAVGAALLGALALTPTLQLRRQALQADAAYNQLVAQTGRLAEERAALTMALERIAQIKQRQAQRVNLAQVLQFLSTLLPADVSLHALEFAHEKTEGGHTPGQESGEGSAPMPKPMLKLLGEADNAAAVIQLLSAQAEWVDVRTTQPVQQIPQANKERFTVEMTIAPGAFNTRYSPEVLPEALPEAEPAPESQPAPEPSLPAAAPSASPFQAAPSAHPQVTQPSQPPAAASPAADAPSRTPPNAGVTPMMAPQIAPKALPVSPALAGQRAAPQATPAENPDAAQEALALERAEGDEADGMHGDAAQPDAPEGRP
ncbi:MAG: hypothetical protein Q4A98_09170 [Comamonadaceae bacterium]|nr:hypothetical protein [Comamonadaceae bacterium]